MAREIKLILMLFITFTFTDSHFFYAQVTQQWAHVYDGSYHVNDEVTGMVIDGAGNVYVTGFTQVSFSYSDYVTIKYNSAGVQQWIATYDGPEGRDDKANAIAIDASGNVYVTGFSSSVTAFQDMVTIKYNSAGIQQWAVRYDGPLHQGDYGIALVTDTSGNVFVTGSSIVNGNSPDYTTIKYNSAGVQQWTTTYNGSGNSADVPVTIGIDASGNIYVTGSSKGTNTLFDFATVKYDPSGVQQWVQRFHDSTNQQNFSISMKVDAPGNVYVSGYGSGMITLKYNSSGVLQWYNSHDGSQLSTDQGNTLAVDANRNVYVTGFTILNGTFFDYLTIKYNSVGAQQWAVTYDGGFNGGADQAAAITVDQSGNAYVTGYITNDTGQIFSTIKYNSVGILQWEITYEEIPVSAPEFPIAIAVDSLGGVYVSGDISTQTYFDIATVKYSQTIGIHSISTEIPGKSALYQNYPNPFNPNTVIRLQVESSKFVKLNVYDVLGSEVAALVNQQMKPGSYSVDFDGSNLASGIYYYSLIIDNAILDTKKLVLIK